MLVQYIFCHLHNRKFARVLAEICRFEAPTEILNFSVTAIHPKTREKRNGENMVFLLKKKTGRVALCQLLHEDETRIVFFSCVSVQLYWSPLCQHTVSTIQVITSTVEVAERLPWP